MNVLVDLSDFTSFRQLTSNIDMNKLNPYIIEAQNFDLRPVLGEAFFYDIIVNPTTIPHNTLINGNDYQNSDDKTVHFEGLKAALCYFAYARYIESGGTHSTSYGLVSKTNDYSQPTPDKTIARMVTQARSSAKGYLDDVLKFLSLNADDYPLWKQGCGQSVMKATGGIKITAVDGSEPDYGDGYYDPNNPHNHNVNYW